MNKFSIFLLTYNRHLLLEFCIRSIREQTYSNYEVFIVDNGSQPPVFLNFFDDRFKLVRYDQNTNGCIVGEEILDKITGNYFVFLADDDAFIPSTLSIVNDVLTDKPSAEIVQTGLAYYNHTTGAVDPSHCSIDDFTGKVNEYDSITLGYYFCSCWGIGKNTETPAPRMAHSSGVFLSVELIRRTRMIQKELFVRPFGDIGYVGALFNTDKLYFIDFPLAVIGESVVREMVGSLPGNRFKWKDDVNTLEHVPLKSCSFINMGADGHLKVLYRNNKHIKYDCRLRPDFFYRHLRQVISDNPRTWLTIKDIAECIRPLIVSMLNHLTVREIVHEILRLLKAMLKKLIGNNKINNNNISNTEIAPDTLLFQNINCFAVWLESNCINHVVSSPREKKIDFTHN